MIRNPGSSLSTVISFGLNVNKAASVSKIPVVESVVVVVTFAKLCMIELGRFCEIFVLIVRLLGRSSHKMRISLYF